MDSREAGWPFELNPHLPALGDSKTLRLCELCMS